MDAGKYIAIERGAFDQEEFVPVTPIPAPRFPLLQRLDDRTLQDLFILRQNLPTQPQ